MIIDPRLDRIVAAQPYPLLFATISGAHLYGFPSPDSDFDLRGVHVLPLEKVVGLQISDETVEQSMFVPPDVPRKEVSSRDTSSRLWPPSPQRGEGNPAGEGHCAEGRTLDMDIVSHDVRKFFGLLLKKNGYVLEQLFSPLIVHTTPEHEELKSICRTRLGSHSSRGHEAHASKFEVRTSKSEVDQSLLTSAATGVITRHHAHHYLGFAETQWKLFLKESPHRVKPLLYVYRVLLTGIHLMHTGVVEANLVTLNEEFRLPYLAELIERKTQGENTALVHADLAIHESEYQRLRGELQAAHEARLLPEVPSDATRAALNDLLIRVRLKNRRSTEMDAD